MRRGVVTLPAIIAVAAVIGWIAPFDLYYTALTGNSPVLRAAVIAALALLGGLAAQAAGLQLAGHGRHGVLRAPAGIGLAAAALVAGWVLLLDCFVFRARLSPGIVTFLRAPLHVRLFYFMLRAFNENVIYRLFGFGGIVWLLGAHGRAAAGHGGDAAGGDRRATGQHRRQCRVGRWANHGRRAGLRCPALCRAGRGLRLVVRAAWLRHGGGGLGGVPPVPAARLFAVARSPAVCSRALIRRGNPRNRNA
jgi:hypothetical protein